MSRASEQAQARSELLTTGAMLMGRIAEVGIDWAKDEHLAGGAHDLLTSMMVYLKAELDAAKGDELLTVVRAWRAQLTRCNTNWVRAKVAIRGELAAVGGYATTTPDERGYCHDYTLPKPNEGDGWFEGATKDGAQHPDVGDRCHRLAMAHRDEAIAVGVAINAVREAMSKTTGRIWPADVHPEDVALAVYVSRGDVTP